MARSRSSCPSSRRRPSATRNSCPSSRWPGRLLAWLNEGKRAASMEMTDEERAAAKGLFLLTMKPILYVITWTRICSTRTAPIDGARRRSICAVNRGRARARSRGRRRLPESLRPSSLVWMRRAGRLQAAWPAVVLLRLARWRSRPGRCVRARPPWPPVSSTPTLSAVLLRPRSLLRRLHRARWRAGAKAAGKLRIEGKDQCHG